VDAGISSLSAASVIEYTGSTFLVVHFQLTSNLLPVTSTLKKDRSELTSFWKPETAKDRSR